MKECSKSIARRLQSPNFLTKYFVGEGIDIGGKPDPLSLYQELFPLMTGVRIWDLEDGDAQHMKSVADDSVDFVHSSHCLEHVHDPAEGLRNWLRILRPGGHLVMTVPDEDLYEQGVFPSTFNRDHKWTFTAYKRNSWSPHSLNLLELVMGLGGEAELLKLELLDATYRRSVPRYDQTLTPVAESGIEVVVRKRSPDEIARGGRLPGTEQPPEQMRLHLNQYRDDVRTLKSSNETAPPFQNRAKL